MRLLDANAFMEAKRLYYSFRIAPGFWEWLLDQFRSKKIASIKAVYDEIAAGDDELSEWAKSPDLEDVWLTDSAASVSALSELAGWATHRDRVFKASAIDEFMASADFRLVAQAKAIGATVVSRETSEPHSRRRIKLPDAAHAIGVRTQQPFSVYEQLGLHLGQQ